MQIIKDFQMMLKNLRMGFSHPFLSCSMEACLMKIKNNKIWFVLNLLTVLGVIGLSIYQICNSELEWTNVLVLIVLICNLSQFIELKK